MKIWNDHHEDMKTVEIMVIEPEVRFARQYFGSQFIDVEVNRNVENDENRRKYFSECKNERYWSEIGPGT